MFWRLIRSNRTAFNPVSVRFGDSKTVAVQIPTEDARRRQITLEECSPGLDEIEHEVQVHVEMGLTQAYRWPLRNN